MESTHVSCIGAEQLMSEPILLQDFEDRMTDDVCDTFDFDTLFDLMWDMDGNDMRRCGLTEESIFLLSSPENEKSKKIYENHQKKYLQYALSTGQEAYTEETMVNYFTVTYEDQTYSPGSFWQMFSCIRSYILVKTKIDIKSFSLPRKLIKSLTVNHLKKITSI